MNIKVTADSTCDLSPELLQRFNITLTPLTVIKDGKPFLDGVEIDPSVIFRHVDAGGALCSTSAVNVDSYRSLFSELSPQYDDVIHITIGSLFSACYQNATIAASAFPNVHVVDSMNLSTGQGHLVIEAAQLAAKGLCAMEICSQLNAMRSRVQASFIMDRLDYMQKGGRCSAVTLLGSKLLKIKPCIAVRDGAMSNCRTARTCAWTVFLSPTPPCPTARWRLPAKPFASTPILPKSLKPTRAARSPATAAPARWACCF